MQKETCPPRFKDEAGRTLPYDLPGVGMKAVDDTAHLELTEAEVIGITAAREAARAASDRGLMASIIAWNEIKADIMHLSDPQHRDEWHAILLMNEAHTEEEVNALFTVARLFQERTARNVDWLDRWRPEIPASDS